MAPVYTFDPVIPSVMGDSIYTCMNLRHQIERIPSHLANIASNLTPNETLLQGPLVQGDEWANAWQSDIPAPIHYYQDNVEVRLSLTSLPN